MIENVWYNEDMAIEELQKSQKKNALKNIPMCSKTRINKGKSTLGTDL